MGSLYLYVHVFSGQAVLILVNLTLIQGWLILCCSHRLRRATDSEFASKPRRPVGLLPEAVRSDARTNIATIRSGREPDPHQFHSPRSLPAISSIGI